MTEWVAVSPLVDASDTQAWEPWQPKVGDRVRVRLSGECNLLAATLNVVTRKKELGHHPEFINGVSGTVIACYHCKRIRCDLYKGHPYRVRLDLQMGDGKTYAAFLAACELEPIDD